MMNGIRFLIILTICGANRMLAQKAQSYVGISAGVELFSKSMLFPYANRNVEGNSTGEIQFTSTNPVWAIGVSFDRIYKKGLVFKARVNYQFLKYGFNTSNNQFEYIDNILISYLTFDFNKVEYKLSTIDFDLMFGSVFYSDRNLEFSILFGPRLLYTFRKTYSHNVGKIYTNGVNDVDNLIGANHIRNFNIGFTIMPQAIFKLTKSLRLVTTVNLTYYFRSLFEYNSSFDGMISSPFKENTSPYISGGLHVGILYKL